MHLCNTKISGAGLENLTASRSTLRHLCLNGSPITDAALPRLKVLSNLEYLRLSRTEVTDAGLVHLESFANLRQVYLQGNKVSNKGVRKLQKALPNTVIRGDVHQNGDRGGG